MVALDGAQRAALSAFLKAKRGQRVLREECADALLAYFAARGTPVAKLVAATPHDGSAASLLEDHQDEWRDYAKSAGLTDEADVKNVARWGLQLIPV